MSSTEALGPLSCRLEGPVAPPFRCGDSFQFANLLGGRRQASPGNQP